MYFLSSQLLQKYENIMRSYKQLSSHGNRQVIRYVVVIDHSIFVARNAVASSQLGIHINMELIYKYQSQNTQRALLCSQSIINVILTYFEFPTQFERKMISPSNNILELDGLLVSGFLQQGIDMDFYLLNSLLHLTRKAFGMLLRLITQVLNSLSN